MSLIQHGSWRQNLKISPNHGGHILDHGGHILDHGSYTQVRCGYVLVDVSYMCTGVSAIVSKKNGCLLFDTLYA